MTWNPADLPRAPRPPEATGQPATGRPAGPPDAPASLPSAGLPRQALLARFAEARPPELSPEIRRELAALGLWDEATWGRWRTLLTRGVYET